MEADLQPLNHGLSSAWRLAQDRERWKQLVETATLHSSQGHARDDDDEPARPNNLTRLIDSELEAKTSSLAPRDRD